MQYYMTSASNLCEFTLLTTDFDTFKCSLNLFYLKILSTFKCLNLKYVLRQNIEVT